MDAPWSGTEWKPTLAKWEVNGLSQPDPSQYQTTMEEVRTLSNDILDLPYEPQNWLFRGQRLLRLGYPDLALGDVYKARLLIEAATRNNCSLGDRAILAYGMKMWYLDQQDPVWVNIEYTSDTFKSHIESLLELLERQVWKDLIEALFYANGSWDSLQLSQQAMKKYPGDQSFAGSFQLAKNWFERRMRTIKFPTYIPAEEQRCAVRSGQSLVRAYPWMTGDLLRRDESLLALLREEFKMEASRCTLGHSTIRGKADSDARKSDMYGVFASQNLRPDEIVLVDHGITIATNAPNRCSCCCAIIPGKDLITPKCCDEEFYCGEACAEKARNTYHSSICGIDFSFVYDAAKPATVRTGHIDNLLLLRFLAIGIQEGASHPLKASIISRLTPQYESTMPLRLDLLEDIINPIRILQMLGIDVFADQRYDTWVLQQMRFRIANNVFGRELGGRYPIVSIYPRYSMFNHSCEPNVVATQDEDSGAIIGNASCKVREGEEVFVSYLEFDKDTPREERQKQLAGWLGGACRCQRCERKR